jgi:hypothetical protein
VIYMGRDVDDNLLPQGKGTSAMIANIVPINLIMGVSYAGAELYSNSRPTSRKPLERRQIRGKPAGRNVKSRQTYQVEQSMPLSRHQTILSGEYQFNITHLLSGATCMGTYPQFRLADLPEKWVTFHFGNIGYMLRQTKTGLAKETIHASLAL